jgi:hypothetical protein
MAAYTIRVELKGKPSEGEYKQLHEAMEALGYLRTVKGLSEGKRVEVDLPTGLYYGTSSKETEAVANGVFSVAGCPRSRF